VWIPLTQSQPRSSTTEQQAQSVPSPLPQLAFSLPPAMRSSARLMASAMSTAKGLSPGPMALLPPIYLYRRLLRAHRKHLPSEMRLLGDEYVKAEFRAHRNVENPAHLVRQAPLSPGTSLQKELDLRAATYLTHKRFCRLDSSQNGSSTPRRLRGIPGPERKSTQGRSRR
jgi:hypothetical protein